MEQYPPQGFANPPKAERAKRRKLNLSPPAAGALESVKRHLAVHPAWLESTTASVLIEFLCWHYEQTLLLDGSPGFKGFRPETRRGRPPGMNEFTNLRPAHARKAAGLSKTEACVGRKPPKG